MQEYVNVDGKKKLVRFESYAARREIIDEIIQFVIADAVTVSVFPFVDKTPKTTLGLARVPKSSSRAARRKTNKGG